VVLAVRPGGGVSGGHVSGSDPAAVRALLARTPLVVRRGPFALGSWPTAQLPLLSALLPAVAARADGAPCLWCVDDLELTALLPERALAELPPPQRVERGWCVLTLDTVMAWDVTGVLAAVAGALAAAGVPLGAVTAFSRDHLLVPSARLPDALAALAGLCGSVREHG
jgi:hypothetical protein